MVGSIHKDRRVGKQAGRPADRQTGRYGVAMISRRLKITGLFCRISSL